LEKIFNAKMMRRRELSDWIFKKELTLIQLQEMVKGI